MDARLLDLCSAANDGLGEELHIAQLFTIKGKIFGKEDSSTREDNITRMVDAIPGAAKNTGAHEIPMELVNKIGFSEEKADDLERGNYSTLRPTATPLSKEARVTRTRTSTA